MRLTFAVVTFAITFDIILSANILFVPMHMEASHKKSMWPLAKSLGHQGHSVRFWSPHLMNVSLSDPDILEDRTTIVPIEDQRIYDAFVNDNDTTVSGYLWMQHGETPWTLFESSSYGEFICSETIRLKYAEFVQISVEIKWDLLVLDSYFSPCVYGLAKLSGSDHILYATTIQAFTTDRSRSIPVPLAHYPIMEHRAQLNLAEYFYDRLDSVVTYAAMHLTYGVLQRHIQSILKGIYDDFSYNEFERQSFLSMTPYPHDLDWPRPRTHDFISSGGLCPSVGQLPTDLKSFVERPDSKGTILIAFGHWVKWGSAPIAVMKAYESALSKLTDYQVVWQFEAKISTKLPDHIRRIKWLPQVALLNHHKTKLFITHAGLKSLQEGICAEVPMLAMPSFAEQFRNTAILEARRMGIYLNKFTLTKESFLGAIIKVLEDKSIQTNVARMNRLLNDKLINPVEVERFVVNHVLRNKRRYQLFHLKATKLTPIEYFALDSISLHLLIVSTFSLYVYKTIFQ